MVCDSVISRKLISVIALLGMGSSFVKLPEIAALVSPCKECSFAEPYLPLIASAYFAILFALSLLFPHFPKSRHIAGSGLLSGTAIALLLIFRMGGHLCIPCLVGHFCSIAIWALWLFFPERSKVVEDHVALKCSLLFLIPVSVVALFGNLNLTLMAYDIKKSEPFLELGMRVGEAIPTVSGVPWNGRGKIFNFVAPDCPFCKEQMEILGKIPSLDITYITPSLEGPLMQLAPKGEWIEDRDLTLRGLFKIRGYPTLYVVDDQGKIAKVIRGVSEELKTLANADPLEYDPNARVLQ